MKSLSNFHTTISGILLLLLPGLANAQGGNLNLSTIPSNLWIEYTFVGVMVGLLLIILLLGRFYIKLLHKKGGQIINGPGGIKSGAILIGFTMLVPVEGFAQEVAASPMISSHLSYGVFFSIIAVIVAELLVIVFLINNISRLLGLDDREVAEKQDSTEEIEIKKPLFAALSLWWTKINAFKNKEKEKEIIIDHDHDGIRELDNDLPPWWVWGFYITIIFSVIYMWSYHVAQTAPLQIEELEIAMAKAEEKMKAYRASSATMVDESSVTVVDDPDYIEKGKMVYMNNCVACHGELGEGGVGPNLTDEYWLHGGSISDIFKVVKYGVIEKGMTPWKDLMSPTQMAQVSNFVLTLQENDPPNAKEPQGTIYTPETTEDENSTETETEIEI